MSRVVDIVDTTTRDGNQSLWSATGLTTADIVAIEVGPVDVLVVDRDPHRARRPDDHALVAVAAVEVRAADPLSLKLPQ